MSDRRPVDVREQARDYAKSAREKMGDRREQTGGGVAGWIADRAGDWSTEGPD